MAVHYMPRSRVPLLLEADVNAASSRGQDNIFCLLLEKGADVNVPEGRNGSALQAAPLGGHENIARLLLEQEADVNLQGGEHDSALQAA